MLKLRIASQKLWRRKSKAAVSAISRMKTQLVKINAGIEKERAKNHKLITDLQAVNSAMNEDLKTNGAVIKNVDQLLGE